MHQVPLAAQCCGRDAGSANRQWIATSDAGPDGILIVWDTRTRVPVRSFFADQARAGPPISTEAYQSLQLPGGVAAVDLSHDAMFLATLSAGDTQAVALWDWTDDAQAAPLMSLELKGVPRQVRARVFGTARVDAGSAASHSTRRTRACC